MTTVAWDGKSIAADRRSSYHGNPVSKLRRMNDGSVCGGAGEAEVIRQMISYLDGTRVNLPDKSEVTVLRAYPGGHADYAHERGELMPITLQFFAIGSGRDYAMGALAMGATAEQAVEIASRYDGDTGGGIDCITLQPVQQDADTHE